LPADSYEEVRFSSIDKGIEIDAWSIPSRKNIDSATVVVVHGINTSRKDFTAPLPAVMLSHSGLNVLLMDLRDSGGSTCEDGRHSAGQNDANDVLAAVYWLRGKHDIPPAGIGIHGVSGGAIAALVVADRSDAVAAFSLEAPIFDFDEAAKQEVRYQGFPEFLWQAAYWAARLRGVDLRAIETREGISQLNGRPLQVFHGTQDSRVKFENSVDLEAFARQSGVEVTLYSIESADHTEGILLEPDLYYRALGSFFSASLLN